jgi:hypothetical protein
MEHTKTQVPTMNTRPAAIAIGVATLAILIFITQHPVLAPGLSTQDALAGIVALRRADQVVHGTLIAVVSLLAYGYTAFALRLGVQRGLVISGLLSYLLACISLVGAMLLDGFITPDIAARFIASPPEQIQMAASLLAFCSICIQVLTKFGFTLISVAFIAWTAAQVRSGDHNNKRNMGVLIAALIAAVVPTLVVIVMGTRLAPHSLLVIFAGQAIWNAMAVKWLWVTH